MFKPFIRLFSFFSKEVNEVWRQPRLVLSLLLGPLLILLLFGVGYQGNQPRLRTAVVLPPEGLGDIDPDALAKAADINFEIVSVDADQEGALQRLRSGELDVVQIFPPDIEQRVLRGEQSVIDFKYNQVNPLNEQWIQYLAYVEVVEINRAILLNATARMQQEASTTSTQLTEVRQQLDQVESNIGSVNQAELQDSLRRLKSASAVLAVSPLLAQATGDTDPQQTRQELLQLQSDLDALDQAITANDLEQQRERVQATRDRIARLEQVTQQVSTLPPTVIVSPLQQTYENINGTSYDLMTFYAPGVLALMIHHIAVTLGSLSLVRDRMLGAYEIFRVAPVSIGQVLIGKYLGYILFIGIIATVLVGLMRLLNIPFLGNPLVFAGLMALLTISALGIGFFISAASKSDSQAVQLSMLVLLMSIFFSGFFLPLENFWLPVRAVGYALPLTHGITGLHAIMLRGFAPSEFAWIALGIIAGVTFIFALVASWLQFRRA